MNLILSRKVSVCLLTYNHAHTIESTLSSILDQTISDYEVVVSDDCSTDDTWERILAMAELDKRIRPVRTPKNLGMPGNANFAVSHAQYPYIAVLHHDDIYRHDLLEKWGAVLERNVGVAFVFNPYGVYQSDFVYAEPIPMECVDGHWLLDKYLLPRWGCAVRGTAMIRRAAWDSVGGMREQYGLLADVDLWMRLAMGWQVGYVAEPLITVRQERPRDYPKDYKEVSWSWRRQRLLYQIHASTRLTYFDLNTLTGRVRWWHFRLRLSVETSKWLLYAVIRGKPAMITSSFDSITPHDLLPLRLLRWSLRRVAAVAAQSNCRQL